MNVREVCRKRTINSIDITTPLVVPSFSSKGFPDIQEIWDSVTDSLPSVILISGYDLYYRRINPDLQQQTLVFLDSGGYEAKPMGDLSEIYNNGYIPQKWDENKLAEVIRSFGNETPMIVVSYDDSENTRTLDRQIAEAIRLFRNYPLCASNFLIKPYQANSVGVDDVLEHIPSLAEFDILGITEKELGISLMERLTNLLRLRQGLNQSGFETPIHIFGCLDPLSIWLYFLCGADIFDGLAWLRFAFVEQVPIYRNNWAIIADLTDVDDLSLRVLSYIHNLRELRKQRTQMLKYTAECVPTMLPKLEWLQKTLGSIGVEIS